MLQLALQDDVMSVLSQVVCKINCIFFFDLIMHFWIGATYTASQFTVQKIRQLLIHNDNDSGKRY